MDIGKALTFVYDEDKWVEKVAIGTGLLIITFLLGFVLVGIIGGFILTGYCLRLLRNVQAGKTQVLPEWNEWGEDLTNGFKLAVVSVVWALPGMIFGFPMILGGFMTEGGEFAQFIGVMLMLCSGVFVFFYSVFVFLAMPGYTIAFAQDGKISSGLQLTEVWNWTRANIGQVIVVAIVVALGSVAAMFLASIVGTVLCIIGLGVTLPLATLLVSFFQYHLYGQLAREYPLSGSSDIEMNNTVVDAPSADVADETA